jgi:hypothetical protein
MEAITGKHINDPLGTCLVSFSVAFVKPIAIEIGRIMNKSIKRNALSLSDV